MSGEQSRAPVPQISQAPTPQQTRRWRRYLANELAEAAVYRDLALRRSGVEREILLALAEAEGRHADHWREKLGVHVGHPRPSDLSTRLLGFFARRFGSVFVLALAQRAETGSPYDADADATAAMGADERIHAEVIRGLAEKRRRQMSGSFRAAIFGANDGLVSNLALVIGVAGSGAGPSVLLLTGLAGLLSGALSMGAGEYVSVRSQRELLDASTPDAESNFAVGGLDVNANELALVYRARGMTAEQADERARSVFDPNRDHGEAIPGYQENEDLSAVGGDIGAAVSSFLFFATGAFVPVLPYLLGLSGTAAIVLAIALVGVALLVTGGVVGLLSGGPPLRRGLRQLAIGLSAAGATYLLGMAFGAVVS